MEKRVKLKASERLGQMRYLLRTRGAMSLQELTRLMGYNGHASLQQLLITHGLPEGVSMYRVKAPATNGSGGNWNRCMFSLDPNSSERRPYELEVRSK